MRLTKHGHSCVRVVDAVAEACGKNPSRRVYAHAGTASTLDRPSAAVTPHDGILDERGLKIVNTHLARLSGTDYAWPRPGTTIN